MSPEFLNIIEKIKAQGSQALNQVYMQYRIPFIKWLQRTYQCETELAKDIYQQSILVFYENCLNERATGLSSIKTYLFSIGKNKYYEAARTHKKLKEVKPDELDTQNSFPEELLERVESALQRLGEPCRSLLIQFYFHQRSNDQLAEIFNYKNSDSAKNQKSKCLERLRKMVKDHVSLSMPGPI